MRLELPVRKLSLVQNMKSAERPNVSVADLSGNPADTQHIPLELVIVGKRIDEALDEVNSYLDQAFLSGLPSVGIVHGMGTGKLKKAVSNFLRSHPHVMNYAIDSHNYGMTNVELARK